MFELLDQCHTLDLFHTGPFQAVKIHTCCHLSTKIILTVPDHLMSPSINKLVINKMDVLRKVQEWKLIIDEQVLNLETETAMKGWIQSNIGEKVEIFFKSSL